jgi:hypothetical protein
MSCTEQLRVEALLVAHINRRPQINCSHCQTGTTRSCTHDQHAYLDMQDACDMHARYIYVNTIYEGIRESRCTTRATTHLLS